MMKKLYEALYAAIVAICFLVVVGFWFGVGSYLGVKAASLY